MVPRGPDGAWPLHSVCPHWTPPSLHPGRLQTLTIFSYTSTSIESWAQQIEIRPYGGWGQPASES
ncbi:MAG TPA: hypothetical protein VGP57_19715 [Actinoplanes sp.]|jgi:hypothetical protein|nr:hypothetical protein [Actinoplanes sp.]